MRLVVVVVVIIKIEQSKDYHTLKIQIELQVI